MRSSCFLTFLLFHCCCALSQSTDYSQLVNPFIGTGGHGHTFPGVAAPFGMVQLSPDTRVDGSWDGCGGYHYSDSVIYGFSHTHLSGTGCSDYGDIMIMPVMRIPAFSNKVYSSKFRHVSEKAHAGYYKVTLDDDEIDVELTASTRAGFHKYTFNITAKAFIMLDLQHRDKLLDDSIIYIDDHTLEGFRRSEGWAKDQRIFFRMEFSKNFEEYIIMKEDSLKGKAAFLFDVKKGESILVKVSLSSVDRNGARKNLEAEIPHWNFEKTWQECENMWNKELGTISVKGGTDDQRTIFYTALYHTFLQPNIYNDIDGRYLGRDFKIHKTEGFNYYTVFSLWDTYRAAHPLYNIVQPARNLDFIKTFLEQYKHCGKLPMWELSSNETECMIGYHAASVIADAVVKGNDDFNIPLAIEACVKNANLQKFGIPVFHNKKYLEIEDESESVSKTLEYAYDDWCIMSLLSHSFYPDTSRLISNYARGLTDYASGWHNLFNLKNGFMQARKNGNWYSPFDPKEVNNNYTEANAWQYSFYVPHDIASLIYAMGGSKEFEKKLDELFTTSSETSGREQADISGMIGQYAHGNEPSHHMAYLYNYIGKPDKAGKQVSRILRDLYKNAPDGLAGNEDCGQMSAWYVFSAMGFYPVCPGENEYIRGAKPIFTEIKIHGKLLDSLKLNINSYNYANDDFYFHSTPVIEAPGRTFKDNMLITITPNGNWKLLEYTFEDVSDTNWITYTEPFNIRKSCKISARNKAWKGIYENQSYSVASFHKMAHNWSLQLTSTYSKQYTADGDEGIIDGLRGNKDWRKGGWQGYQGQDFETIVDLKKETMISNIGLGLLQDARSWILMPKEMHVEISTDGKKFEKVGFVKNTIADSSIEVQVKDMNLVIKPSKARFVKIKAIQFGNLPAWHPGAGGESFIFVDEILIK